MGSEKRAVKVIDKDALKPEEKELLYTEIAVLKLVHHPHIIEMIAVYEDRRLVWYLMVSNLMRFPCRNLYIVMELLEGGELFERIVGKPRFNEDQAFDVLYIKCLMWIIFDYFIGHLSTCTICELLT